MNLITLSLGLLKTNCYIIYDKNNIAVIIDPAGEEEKIFRTLEENKLQLKAILLTHAHYDHIMALEPIVKRFSDTLLYLHKNEEEYLRNPELNLSPMVSFKPYSSSLPATLVEDGDIIKIGEMSLEVIHTPGHTKGSVCYLTENMIFSGDTLFAGTVGRTDFPGGSYDDICLSVARLAHLPGDYDIYPGHEEKTTLDKERKYNPYIKI